jgi:ubiquitin carboxyl-terminal hydrolase 4/11/15
VSKQKDVSRVVTKAAYLLFYRRRSDVPLGGPRFKEIFEAYDQQTNHSEESDSGEGQRLGQGSGSQRGSPSASTGAGRTALNGNHGLASAHSGGAGNFGNANDATEYSPLYKSLDMDDTLGNADDDADDYQMSGMNQWQADDARPSIERDEGIDMGEWDFTQGRTSSGPLIQQGWNFSAINGGLARSEADNGSDVDSVTAHGDDGSSLLDDMVDEEAQYAKIDLAEPYPRHVSTVVDDDSAPPSYEEVALSISADDITGVVDAEMDEIKDGPVTEIHLDDVDEVRDVKRVADGPTKAN